MAPSRTVGVSASLFLPLHHKVQKKISFGTSLARSPGKVAIKWWCVCDITLNAWVDEKESYGGDVSGGHSVMVLYRKRYGEFQADAQVQYRNRINMAKPI